MGFNADKLREMAKPRSAEASQAAARRRRDRKWVRMSQDIALAIRQHLREAGMTQKDFATKLKVSPAYVGKILKGQENMTLETISMIQEALGHNLISIKATYAQAMTVRSTSFTNFSGTVCSRKYNNTQQWKDTPLRVAGNVA